MRDQTIVNDIYGYSHCYFVRGDKRLFGMDVRGPAWRVVASLVLKQGGCLAELAKLNLAARGTRANPTCASVRAVP